MADSSSVLGGASKGAAAGAMLGPWGALAGGVLGAAGGLMAGNAAAAAQKKAAMEQLRRDDLHRNNTLGQGYAAEGASGFEFGKSSLSTYMASMASEFRREQAWQIEQAANGQSVQNQANTLDFAASASSSLFKFGEANKWWMTNQSGG